MNHLLRPQIATYLNQQKPIEQLIGFFESDGHKCLRWIEIQKDKVEFILVIHEVLDDGDNGIESIYDYTYLDPDQLHGQELFKSLDLEVVLKYAEENFAASREKYTPAHYLDDALESKRISGQ